MNCYNCNSSKLLINVEEDAYVCQECGFKHYKQYFFISHSHKDIEKVRIIRNVIEETFFYEPILFFLKCLSDENEVTSLIQREIKERIWFVYCKSENAEKSKYVQMEREYIKKLISEGKNIHILEIDIDKYEIWDKECYNYIREQIAFKVRKTNIFISYSHRNYQIANLIIKTLKENGFTVFYDETFLNGDMWNIQIKSEIKKHSYKDGAVVVLCTEEYFESDAVSYEVAEAIMNNALLIPVILYEDTEQLNRLFRLVRVRASRLMRYSCLTVNINNLNNDIQELIKGLLNYNMNH